MNDYFLNEIDLDGFQVVKSQYFQKQAEPVLTLWATSIAFGQGAYQALNSCESIQLMINERRKSIIIRPSSSSMPDAIVWKKGKSEPKYCKMDCAQLGRKIFEMWNFDSRYHYKAYGRLVQVDQKVMLLFDFNNADAFAGTKRVDGNE